jgi:hypothetical protein
MSGTEWKPIESSVWQYGWVTDPPVESVSIQQVLLLKQQMKQAIGLYVLDIVFDDKSEQRVKDTYSILDLMKGSDCNLVYKVLDTPIGIICLSKHFETVYINYIATHPGTVSAGGILMEAAADYSQKCGFGGKLELFSFSEASTLAYKAMGFIAVKGKYTESCAMTLDPSTSGSWTFQGRWRILKYETVKYHGTRKKPVPKPPPNNNF